MTEKEFISYFGKKVKIYFNDGFPPLKGFVSSFNWAEDNEEGETSITIDKDFDPNRLIIIFQSEVENIEVIK